MIGDIVLLAVTLFFMYLVLSDQDPPDGAA